MKTLIILILLVVTNLTTYYILSNGNETQLPVHTEKPFVVNEPSRVKKFAGVTAELPADLSTASLADVGEVLLSMEDSDLKDSLLGVLAAGWFNRDHISFAEWLNDQNPVIDTDPLNARFANLATEIDPEGAIEWAASVMRPQLREQAIRRAVEGFQKYDPIGYQNFLERGGSSVRAIYSLGLVSRDADEAVSINHDIVEEPTESIAEILARRTHLAGSSSRPNKVDLDTN